MSDRLWFLFFKIMKFKNTGCLFVLSIVLSAHALADDLANYSLSQRFPGALSHLSFYGDVSAKSGASAASKWESSPNPANKGWGFAQDYDWRLSGQYNNISFANGTQLNVTSQTATMDAGDLGVLRMALLQINSNTRPAGGALALPFQFNLTGFQLSWGKKLSRSFSLGLDGGFTHGDTSFKLPAFDLAHTDKDTYNFRIGGLWQPSPKWYAGLYGDFIYGSASTMLKLPTPFGIVQSASTEVVKQYMVHPGLAYEFAENAMIHADYEAGWISNQTKTLLLERFAMGTDIPLAQFFYLRAGSAVDSRGNASWSTGVGFYPSKHVFIDCAYQNNVFPELSQEFGRSETLNASVSIQW